MESFAAGPFGYIRSGRTWTLEYNGKNLGSATLGVEPTRTDIIDALADHRSDFIRRLREENDPDWLYLIDQQTDESIAAVAVASWPDGMTSGLIDDSARYWLRSEDRLRSMPVTLSEFAKLAARHAAPKMHWLARLLPDDVLSENPAQWRAPTSWELRHVVGEGSLTGISGSQAAELVGVSAQNWRKYTAIEGSRNRQPMSFAMWHLLLHKLGVKRLEVLG